jgi:thiamine-monophosphate kinase
MRLSELGESGLIDLIRRITRDFGIPEYGSWKELLIGIGDDAAAWQIGDNVQLATTDTLVEGTHFTLGTTSLEELGWKALAVNLSDIAAMGGIPKYALVSLALPGQLEVESISTFYSNMMHLAVKFGVAIVGGNMVSAPNIVINVTVIGDSKGGTLLKRSTALPGEQIAVTGYLGLSAAGLEMLEGKFTVDLEKSKILRLGYLNPMPRVAEGRILVAQGVKSAIDISDGLIIDLDHICEASKVNARINIEQVPVHPIVGAIYPDSQQLALCGGEDYELLFTANETTIDRVKQALDCPVTVIGEVMEAESPKRVTVVDSKGNFIPFKKEGWEHFKNETSKADFV